MRKVFGLVLIGSLFLAAPASAQSLSSSALKVDFNAPAMKATAPSVNGSSVAEAPAARRGGGMSWTPMVIGGIVANGGVGLAAGAAVRGKNLANNEKFGLQFDGFWSNAGYCSGCDDFFGDDDFSSSQISISGAFLYMLSETASGWQMHVGGGPVFVRHSVSYDTNIIGIPVDFSASGTSMGFQGQFGMTRNRLSVDFRAQGVGGGGFAALLGYSFGGSK